MTILRGCFFSHSRKGRTDSLRYRSFATQKTAVVQSYTTKINSISWLYLVAGRHLNIRPSTAFHCCIFSFIKSGNKRMSSSILVDLAHAAMCTVLVKYIIWYVSFVVYLLTLFVCLFSFFCYICCPTTKLL